MHSTKTTSNMSFNKASRNIMPKKMPHFLKLSWTCWQQQVASLAAATKQTVRNQRDNNKKRKKKN